MYAYALSGCLLFHVPCWLSLLWKSMYQNWFLQRFFLSLYKCSTLSINLSTASTIYKNAVPKGDILLQVHSCTSCGSLTASHSGFFLFLFDFLFTIPIRSYKDGGGGGGRYYLLLLTICQNKQLLQLNHLKYFFHISCHW